jgi:hypothetical protein
MSINVWRLAGDTLDITCNFLYCNQPVHRDFLITLYIIQVIKSRRMRGVGHGEIRGERRNIRFGGEISKKETTWKT